LDLLPFSIFNSIHRFLEVLSIHLVHIISVLYFQLFNCISFFVSIFFQASHIISVLIISNYQINQYIILWY
jgi:hypothetical protein